MFTARDFVRVLLGVDPTKDMSLADALCHRCLVFRSKRRRWRHRKPVYKLYDWHERRRDALRSTTLRGHPASALNLAEIGRPIYGKMIDSRPMKRG